jgi:hypothetical protein
MAQWRKVIVSGSNSELNQITSSGGIDILSTSITGSSTSTGSFGYLNVSGDGVFGGNLTFGDANTDSVSFSADIDSNLIPNTDDTYDLGSATQAWQDLFLEGDITLTDAGTIKASAGNLTVDSEAGNLVLDGHTGVDIDASNSGKVSIDGAGGIDIGVAADVAIDIDSSTLDIDASNAITIDGTSTFSLDVAGNTNIDTSTGTISLGTANSGIAVNIGHSTSEVTIGDNLTVNGNATVTGDLDVNGTLTTIDTTNLRIKDQFVLVASGSTTGDGGIIANTTADGSGSALFYDHSSVRWGLARSGSAGHTQTAVTTHQFVVSVSGSAVSPGTTPNDFGTSDTTRIGMMHVNTDNGEIWIYS